MIEIENENENENDNEIENENENDNDNEIENDTEKGNENERRSALWRATTASRTFDLQACKEACLQYQNLQQYCGCCCVWCYGRGYNVAQVLFARSFLRVVLLGCDGEASQTSFAEAAHSRAFAKAVRSNQRYIDARSPATTTAHHNSAMIRTEWHFNELYIDLLSGWDWPPSMGLAAAADVEDTAFAEKIVDAIEFILGHTRGLGIRSHWVKFNLRKHVNYVQVFSDAFFVGLANIETRYEYWFRELPPGNETSALRMQLMKHINGTSPTSARRCGSPERAPNHTAAAATRASFDENVQRVLSTSI